MANNLIVGGGPAGSYMAYLLARKGEKVDLYERNPRQDKNPKPCLTPDTLVVTGGRDVVKCIKDIRVGDLVFTHVGRFRRVLAVTWRDYDGEIITLTTAYGDAVVRITPEHPVLIMREADPKARTVVFGWIQAGELSERDYVVFPFPEKYSLDQKRLKALHPFYIEPLKTPFVDMAIPSNAHAVPKGILSRFFPVREIKHEHYSGNVYNLVVDEDNTYVLPYMTVHNCSGGVARWWLSQTGVPVSSEFIGDTIKTVRILYGKKVIWESSPGGEAGLILTRGKFERFLQKEAADLGARVHYEARYNGFSDYDRVYIAEGASGQVKKRLGLAEPRNVDDFHLGVQLIGSGPVEPHTIEVYADDILQGGYCWRFPHELGVEVGLGIPASHGQEAWPILGKWLDKMGWKVNAQLRQTHIIPTNYPQRQDWGKFWLLGDAAYLTSPISGGGIHAALFSAKRAAEGRTVGRKFALQSRIMYMARNKVISLPPSRVAELISGLNGVTYNVNESPYDKLVYVLKVMRKGLGLMF